MKEFILFKQTKSVQLAHLYEHIFYAKINQLFCDNNLFLRLDYSIAGSTFYKGGIVAFELELYNQTAISVAAIITTLTIDFNKATIASAMNQLLAEETNSFGTKGYDSVKLALERLHQQSWHTIAELESIDVKGFRAQAEPLYLIQKRALPTRKFLLNIMLKPTWIGSHRHLLPLFHQLAWFVLVNIRWQLAAQHGYFPTNTVFVTQTKKTALTQNFMLTKQSDVTVNLSRDLNNCRLILQKVKNSNAFIRYVAELRNASYYHRPNFAPGWEENFEETQLLIGSKGWQAIATQENLTQLLEQMSIEITYGRQKIHESHL